MLQWFIAALCVIGTSVVLSLPDGAPNKDNICRSMLPEDTNTTPQTRPRPFDITTSKDSFRPGELLKVTIRMKDGEKFRGFLIQARLADPSLKNKEFPIGYFQQTTGTKIICSGDYGNALTHSSSSEQRELIALDWTSPTTSQGHVLFRVTLVVEPDRYWIQEKSRVIRDIQAPYTPELFRTPAPVTLPDRISAEQCGRSKGCYRNPPGCHADNCDILVTWSDQGQYVDFQMTADSEGWVAVGFSDDLKMGKDEVWECAWNESAHQVNIKHTRNTGKSNIAVGVTQQGLFSKSGYVADRRISCYFRQNKTLSGHPNLFSQRSHLLLAKGRVGPTGQKLRHALEASKYPYVSTQKVSVTEKVDITHTARYVLVKVHGCLMLIAWMMCASTALILAKYYKPMWPNSAHCGERVWFAWHRGLMVTCLFCTVIAFIIIFVHTYGYSQMPDYPDKAHPPLGICTTILCVLNPLIALCRPSEKSKWRPLFNWFHWLFGTCAAVLATPTIFIGLNLPKSHVPWWATWVMVAFMLFHLVIELMLEIHGCLNAKKQKSRNLEYEKRLVKGEYEPEPVGTRFKKIILTIYVIVVVCLGIVMVISVAAG